MVFLRVMRHVRWLHSENFVREGGRAGGRMGGVRDKICMRPKSLQNKFIAKQQKLHTKYMGKVFPPMFARVCTDCAKRGKKYVYKSHWHPENAERKWLESCERVTQTICPKINTRKKRRQCGGKNVVKYLACVFRNRLT